MRSSKKVILSIVIFLLTAVIISVFLIAPYMNSEVMYYEDAKLRSTLAGKIDYVICGASQGLHSFVPEVLDSELDCSSYNLCGNIMPIYGRTALLREEFARNDISTVVIEISGDALTRDQSEEHGEGDSFILPRLNSFGSRMGYIYNNVPFGDYANVYSFALTSGVFAWAEIAKGNTLGFDYKDKGFSSAETQSVALDPSQVSQLHNRTQNDVAVPRTENEKQLEELIKLCEDNNARVIFAVVPVSDSLLWRNSNYGKLFTWIKERCEKGGYEIYDFNLLKNRYDLFSDERSFNDESHLSDEGARIFSLEYSKIMKLVDEGKDVSGLFFNDYVELDKLSPYNQYLG